MMDNRNISSCGNQDGRGTVCIDTKRVLDSCRDRDCFENVRVYLTATGEEIISGCANVRSRYAEILWAQIGVDSVPFNSGFYRIMIRYYVLVELEACVAIGRSQTFYGISVLEKEVILYGGEGNVKTFASDPNADFCSFGEVNLATINAPTAIVETVEPVILGMQISDCNCSCNACEIIDIPEALRDRLDGDLVLNSENARIYVSLGIFSVIRIVRSSQLLIQATDYSVPEKECVEAKNDEDPCCVFRNMPFPTSSFSGTAYLPDNAKNNRGRGGCGCGK